MVSEETCAERMKTCAEKIYERIWWIVGTLIAIALVVAAAEVGSHVNASERITRLETQQASTIELLREIREDVKAIRKEK